jgi:ABC-type Fe3+/spermidine/putrescine transport system ATPase subunit
MRGSFKVHSDDRLLWVDGVSKRFGETIAVDEVHIGLAQGEILCLLGPSGCGKTTLLRLVAGLEQADSGHIFFAGKEMTHVPPFQRGFGMMFQNFALFPHLNVFENVAYGLKTAGRKHEAVRLRVEEMLALVDLAGLGERQIDQLSGGQQQRIALARALATSPKLLMLDEPLGALDRALRERLMIELRAILQRVGVTAIYVTHDQAEAYAVSDRIAVMNTGKIAQIDTPQTLYAKPKNGFVARFLGFSNVVAGRWVGNGLFECPFGRLLTDSDGVGAGEVLIRPNALISEPATARASRFAAQLIVASFRGRYTELHFDLNGTRLEFEVADGKDWKVGNNYSILLDSAKIAPL